MYEINTYVEAVVIGGDEWGKHRRIPRVFRKNGGVRKNGGRCGGFGPRRGGRGVFSIIAPCELYGTMMENSRVGGRLPPTPFIFYGVFRSDSMAWQMASCVFGRRVSGMLYASPLK